MAIIDGDSNEEYRLNTTRALMHEIFQLGNKYKLYGIIVFETGLCEH